MEILEDSQETNTTAKVVYVFFSENHPQVTYSEKLEVCKTPLVTLVKLDFRIFHGV